MPWSIHSGLRNALADAQMFEINMGILGTRMYCCSVDEIMKKDLRILDKYK